MDREKLRWPPVRVPAELSGRRLAVALILLGLLPTLLAVAAYDYQAPDPTPGPAEYNPLSLPVTPLLTALQAREFQRSRRLSRESPALTRPMLTGPTFPDVVPSIVLAPRERPYRLEELRRELPSAFGEVGDALLLRANVEVPRGTHLVIASAETPDVRLMSSPTGFAAIISRGGEIDITGTRRSPVRIASWDERSRSHDTDPTNGRSFILSFGRLDITHADLGFLGFGTGSSSGVAWRGQADVLSGTPAWGNVTYTTMHHNWFGAYTFEAQDMRWEHNVFAHNDAYGFDPHDFSNGFIVEDNVAYANGRHGFIFSRGCAGNILRNNVAFGNRGHGFMIDDGRSEDSDYAEARRLPSNDNQLVGNGAYDNDGSGIEIEGGEGNIVRGNVLERNHVGVRIKDRASVTVVGNKITESRLFGVDVLTGAGEVAIEDNDVSGGWGGISLGTANRAVLSDNVVEDTSTPLSVAGRSVRALPVATAISKFYKWNPLLILWTSILGVPLLVGILRMLSPRLKRRSLDVAPS
jgi:parallel beta-helix repeat protein